MIRRCLVGLSGAILLSAGCSWDDLRREFNAWESSRPVDVPREQLPKASLEAATRVDAIGAKILAANPDAGVRPTFFTIGVPDLTLFHRGTHEIYISEGLVSKCKNDGELAAALCSELGKMAAEVKVQSSGRVDEHRRPPASPRIGSDAIGGRGDPDQTHLAEEAYWQRKNPTADFSATSDLARDYLTKTGFSADDWQRIEPLVRQAEKNPTFEKQFRGNR